MVFLNKNSVSLAGEFAVLSQLSLRGFDANMTLGHTKGVDILVSNPSTGKMFKIEVKTSVNNKPLHSKIWGYRYEWIMNEKSEATKDPNLFYCFVNINTENNANSFNFYIVPSEVVAKYTSESHRFWKSQGNHKDTSMRKFALALEVYNSPVETPLAKDYENRWEFFNY